MYVEQETHEEGAGDVEQTGTGGKIADVALIRSFCQSLLTTVSKIRPKEKDIKNDDFISWDSKQCARMQHFIISCWKINRSIWLPAAEIPTFLSHFLFSFFRVPSYKF